MMIKGQNLENIDFGDSFTAGRPRRRDASTTCSPIRPSAWSGSRRRRFIRDEAETLGFDGRFGAGLPRINDGSFLFLQHMISQDEARKGGSRLAIVFNGSPLFTGDAGSGESEIRRWIIENDWLEAIVALPDQLFYNTGISTYIWIVTNRKRPERRGKVQLIDATELLPEDAQEPGQQAQRDLRRADRRDHAHLRRVRRGRALQDLRQRGLRLPQDHRRAPLRLNFQASEERLERLQAEKAWQKVKDQDAVLAMLRAMPGELFTDRPAFEAALKGAARAAGLKLDAPLKKAILAALSERDETAAICLDAKGNPEPDPDLRDTESVPLDEDIDEYVAREVSPYVPDAWVDDSKTKIGYEINFNRYFSVRTAASARGDRGRHTHCSRQTSCRCWARSQAASRLEQRDGRCPESRPRGSRNLSDRRSTSQALDGAVLAQRLAN